MAALATDGIVLDPPTPSSSLAPAAEQRLRRRNMAPSESEPRALSSEKDDDRFVLKGQWELGLFLSL